MRARRLVADLHAWAGALLSVVVIAVALSGAALAFASEMFRWQYGAMLDSAGPATSTTTPAEAPPVGAWVEAAEAGYGQPFQAMGVYMPHTRLEIDTAMVFGTRPGGGGLEDTVMLVVDPATGGYKGSFLLDDAWGHKLIHFHHDLFIGEWGVLLTSVLGLLMAAFALSGLWLWWPRRGSAARKARLPHLGGRPLGRWYRLHGWVGFWAALPILLFALSGTAVSKPGWFGGLLASLPYAPPAGHAAAFATRCSGAIDADAASAAAMRAFPGARVASIGFPHEAGEAWRVTLKDAGSLDRVDGDALAFVHGSCLGVIRTAHAGEAGAATRLGSVMFSLHSGRLFGPWLGDALVLLAGLAAALLSGSGLYVWAARTLRRPGRHPATSAVPAE